MRKEELLQEATKTIAYYLKKEKPYLFTIDEVVAQTGDGIITFSLRVYRGFVTDVILQERAKRIIFKRAIDKRM